MPLDRLSRRTVTLALLVAPAAILRAAPIAAEDATPVAEGRYISEQFGYEITWPVSWTLVQTDSEPDGYDMVELALDDATAFIIISRPGDTPLGEIAEFMIGGPPSEETFVPGMVETDVDGAEIQGATAERAWVAYAGNLAGEDVDGFTEFRYGEVRQLERDLAVGLSYAMPAGGFDGNVAPFSALLDGVAKFGGTPVAE